MKAPKTPRIKQATQYKENQVVENRKKKLIVIPGIPNTLNPKNIRLIDLSMNRIARLDTKRQGQFLSVFNPLKINSLQCDFCSPFRRL